MITAKSIINHEKALKEKIFFNKEKWPHFDLLFDDIKKISKKTRNKNVTILERNGLYGGISLLAPFFSNHNELTSIDCSTNNIKKRGGYNKHLTLDQRIIKIPTNFKSSYKKIKLKKNSSDLIIIPNLLHHIDDVDILFQQVKKILRPKGTFYLFEPLVRELHQIPDDFIRYTPYGLESKLKKLSFKKKEINLCGGPFSVIAYAWDQSLQYLPSKLREEYKNWFYGSEFQKLMSLDKRYKTNKIRKNSKFPMSFSLNFVKTI